MEMASHSQPLESCGGQTPPTSMGHGTHGSHGSGLKDLPLVHHVHWGARLVGDNNPYDPTDPTE